MPAFLRPRLCRSLTSLAAALACCASAHAADWLTVASDRVRRVELDKGSITPSDSGTKVAWGRIVLSDEQAKAYGYRTVRALNRYDCRSHSFIIVKRVYLSSDDNVLREDKVDATTPISVKTGTVDDRFFNEVCKGPTVTDLQKTARDAARRLAAAEDTEKDTDRDRSKPTLRRADIQLTRDEPAAPPMPTVKPEAATNKSASSPAAKAAAEKAPVEKAEARAGNETSTPAGNAAPAHRNLPASSGQSATERLIAEQAAARAAARVAAMSPQKAPAVPFTVKRPTATPTPATGTQPMQHEAGILHWSYEGMDGPENWGKLDPEFSVCSNGKRQSPIDIRDGIKVDQEAIQFDYKPSYFRIVDNGHTIQVTYGAGSRISIMGRTYDLVQFHFHHPAEERVNGKGYAMVAHLVHRDQEGHLAVVAVLLESGQANAFIQTLWNNLPLEKNEDYSPRVSIQLSDLLPTSRDYFSYIGSLTTPPCTEGVLWLVMKQPVQLSAEQIDVFSRFYPSNARPLQAASGRIIKESR